MKIFPKEIIENTSQVHEFKHSTRSKIIYMSILTLIISALACLPFVYINIYTSSTGIIRSSEERISLQMLYSGKIKTINLKNNQKVNKGDVLMVLESKEIKEKLNFIDFQLKTVKTHISELK
ncbi:MAG: biotin/lipoyl-binding protein, partial [Flavobacteriaceae bacterium]|nr:biotin/lipoyl-binding protein [Flavobacteriaceae bacterium]